jgi:hypothetical protein
MEGRTDMLQSTSRARLAVSAVATAGLCLAGTAALTPPTHAATGICDTAFPVADLMPDQAVHGLTVTSGTTPTTFDGSIIGVMKDGIEPGVDLVMAKLSSPAITEAGIWAGMSGSPVYAENGDLIGAVSYTLSFGQTSVAGITPWEDMQAWAGHPAPPGLRVAASTARRIAAKTSVTRAQAAQGFHELKAPMLVSGLPQRVLDRSTGRPYLTKGTTAAGQAAVSPTVADIVAGGNLVATASTGDIVQGGLGTITSVCNDRVVGFGHPMSFVGRTTFGLAGADTLFIQPDALGGSFKVANIGDVLGTIDQDRATGISGVLGDLPPEIDITSTVTYTPDGGTPRTRTGTSQVQVPDASADTAFFELLANHQTVLDAYQPGSEHQSWTVSGHTASGPFTLTGSNVYTDRSDIAFGSVFDLPDLLWLLHGLHGVTVDSVHVTSDVDDSITTLKIKGLQQHRGGQWVAVDRHHPARGRAGHDVRLRLVFDHGRTGHAFGYHLPKSSAGMHARIFASRADSFPFERSRPHDLAGVKKLVDTMTHNDQAQVFLVGFNGRHSLELGTTTPGEGTVVGGRAAFRLFVS